MSFGSTSHASYDHKEPPAGMAATTPLHEALNKGTSSGNLVDAKIILYSHRDSSGRICRPKALYASSHVLKTVPYFNDRECTATVGFANLMVSFPSAIWELRGVSVERF